MAAASSIGSDLVAATAALLVAVLVLLVLRFFLPLRSTPAYVLIPVFLAVALPASAILLVPVDLASTVERSTRGARAVWLPEQVVLLAWRITYWLCFALTW